MNSAKQTVHILSREDRTMMKIACMKTFEDTSIFEKSMNIVGQADFERASSRSGVLGNSSFAMKTASA